MTPSYKKFTAWIPKQKDVKVEIALESTPLEIQTHSTGLLRMKFYNDQNEFAGKIDIELSLGTSRYRLNECMNKHTDFNPNLKTVGETNIWRVEKKKVEQNRLHIILLCNGNEVSFHFYRH